MTEIASVGLELARADVRGRVLEGYASVFNYPIDEGNSLVPLTTFIRPGAFKHSIQNRMEHIVALFNHGLDPRYGQLPIGRITDLAEDSTGLHTRIELHDGPDNDNIKAALESGSLWGMSIQFDTVQQDFSEDHSERNVRQTKLYELGPVTFPKNLGARGALHSRDDLLKTYTSNPGAEASSEGAAQAPPKDDRLTLVKAQHTVDLERWAQDLEAQRKRIEGK